MSIVKYTTPGRTGISDGGRWVTWIGTPRTAERMRNGNCVHDAIFARAGWLSGAGNRDTAVGFVEASILGWIYCRDHQDDCVQFVTKANPSLGTSHQRWMLNGINALIWPAAQGIGIPDPDQWEQTISLAVAAGVIAKRPSADANDQTVVTAAADLLSDQDLQATGFQTGVVAVQPGGR